MYINQSKHSFRSCIQDFLCKFIRFNDSSCLVTFYIRSLQSRIPTTPLPEVGHWPVWLTGFDTDLFDWQVLTLTCLIDRRLPLSGALVVVDVVVPPCVNVQSLLPPWGQVGGGDGPGFGGLGLGNCQRKNTEPWLISDQRSTTWANKNKKQNNLDNHYPLNMIMILIYLTTWIIPPMWQIFISLQENFH